MKLISILGINQKTKTRKYKKNKNNNNNNEKGRRAKPELGVASQLD